MILRVIHFIEGLGYDILSAFRGNKIFVCGFFSRRGYKYLHNNWGDDINIYFLEELLNKNILIKNTSYLFRFLPITNYSCIGSIIGRSTDRYSIVWGSGLISENTIVKHPLKICSVRGPYTRQALINQGLDCPPVYGDPALLVSRFYKPLHKKRYRIGIIPHYSDENNQFLKTYVSKHDDVLLISMSNYTNWREIPDAICSCDCIFSSSLHGIIIADSYGIPSARLVFSDDIVGGDFKYRDYYASVNRTYVSPIVINSDLDLDSLNPTTDNLDVASNINYQEIINACPFKLKGLKA